jgi:hypothetical protein
MRSNNMKGIKINKERKEGRKEIENDGESDKQQSKTDHKGAPCS